MKENALNIFVEDPLKELSEEVIQKMPQFDTFDEFAEIALNAMCEIDEKLEL